MCKNSLEQPKQQWGNLDVGALLRADAAVVDVVVTVITTGVDSNNATDRTTTIVITCRVDLQFFDATMARATLVATMEEVAVIASALV